MEEELKKFNKNKVWTIVPKSENISIIEKKCIFENKMDESGKVVWIKALPVTPG